MITSICRNAVAAMEGSIRQGYYPETDRAVVAPTIGVLLTLVANYESVEGAGEVLRRVKEVIARDCEKNLNLREYLAIQLSDAPEILAAILPESQSQGAGE